MNCNKLFRIMPGTNVKLKNYDPGFTGKYKKKGAVLSKCSTKDAPWFVIPSDHK